MDSKLNIDKTDIQILQIIQEDSKIAYKDIAQKLDISLGTVHVRIKKLESMNVIKDFTVNLDYFQLGYELMAFIGLIINGKQADKVIKALEKVPEIAELHHTTGGYHMLAKIICKNTHVLRNIIIHKINSIEGIEKTETIVSLAELFHRKIQIEE